MKKTAYLIILLLCAYELIAQANNVEAAKKALYSRDISKALSLIQTSLREQNANPEVLILAGEIFTEAGKYDSAMVLYKNAEKLQDGNYGIPRRIGQLYARMGDLKNALLMLQKALKANDKDAWNQLAIADYYAQAGNDAEAEKSYANARKLNTRLWQACAGQANLALKKKNLEAARLYFEDALKIDAGLLDIRRQHVALVRDDKDPDPGPDETIVVTKPPYVDGASIQKNLEYPPIAKKAGIEGIVTLRVLIRKDGKVKNTVIENTDSELFNKAAIEAVRKTPFLPAIQNGKPIACWLSVPISFKLR
jgi:protein TonB